MNDTKPSGDPSLGTFYVGDSGARLTVFREVAPILIGFATDFHDSVEALDPRGCQGDSHPDGMRLNRQRHPVGVGATFTTRQILTVGRLMDKWSLGGRSLLHWGAHDSHPREGYFRMDVPRDVWEPAIALLQTPPPPGTPKREPLPYVGPTGSRTLRLRVPRMRGDDVRWLHQVVGVGYGVGLNEVADGVYGPSTETAVQAYQLGLARDPDGVVGPVTWQAMLG